MCLLKPVKGILFVLWIFWLSLGLIGCAGKSQPSKFYLLRSLAGADSNQVVGVKRGPSVLVGPITLPAYLDRSQVVSIKGEYELHLDEFKRALQSGDVPAFVRLQAQSVIKSAEIVIMLKKSAEENLGNMGSGGAFEMGGMIGLAEKDLRDAIKEFEGYVH